MSDGSPIDWLSQPGFEPYTLNFVLGCTPRSDGCKFCFAPRWVARQAHYPGRGGIVAHDEQGRLAWTGKVLTFVERLAPLMKIKRPRMVFVTALGELFDPQVTDDSLVALWRMMAATPQHTYVILSKLSKRMHDKVSMLVRLFGVLPNVWIGASVENQEQANIRLPWLVKTPAAIRLVSCEPLLAPIDLTRIPAGSVKQPDMVYDVLGKKYGVPGRWKAKMSTGIDWVIIGGEAAAKADARPMHPDWARSLIRQATGAGVAVFFKQWGSWGPAPWVVKIPDEVIASGDPVRIEAAKDEARKVGATHSLPVWAHEYDMKPTEAGHATYGLERHELPADSPHAPMRFYPGKSAGHVIDGRVWHQWPSIDGRIIEAPREEVPVNV